MGWIWNGSQWVYRSYGGYPTLYDAILQHMNYIKSFLDDSIFSLKSFLQNLVDETFEGAPQIDEDEVQIEEPNVPDVPMPDAPDDLSFGVSYPDEPPTSDITFPSIPPLDLTFPDIDVSLDDIPVPPDFTESPPTINLPDEPEPFNESLPDAPSLDTVTVEDVELPSIPSVPDFTSISLPDAIPLDMPSFEQLDTTFLDNLRPPSSINWSETEYQAEYLGTLLDKLWQEINEGGTGIPEPAERAIWERGREREDEAYRRAVSKIIDTWSASGMRLPNGFLSRMINEFTFDKYTKEVDRSREIMFKQAQLEQENRRFAMDKLVQIEQLFLQHHEQVMERALRATLAATEVGVSLYRAQVEAYNSRLASIRTAIELFQAKLNAQRVKAEYMRTLLERYRTENEYRRLLLERYRMELAGIEMSINLARMKLDKARLLAELQRLKIENYRSRVEAFNSLIRAKVAEYDLYRAKIEGQIAKTQLYTQQVNAYEAKVSAYRGRVEAERSKIQAQVAVLDANIRKEETKLREWAEKVRAMVDKTRAEVEIYNSQVRAYSAKQGAYSDWLRSLSEFYSNRVRAYAAKVEAASTKLRGYIEKARLALDTSKAKAATYLDMMRQELEVFIRLANLNADKMKTIGQFYASIASSAMQALHAGTNLSDSVSHSEVKQDIYEHTTT